MIKLKRIMICILVLILSTALFGCRNINLKSSTIINENDSGTIKLQIRYDDFISSMLKKDVMNHEWAEENGYFFDKYSKNNMNVEEITYRFRDFEDLEQKINSSGLATMTYSKIIGVGENTYYTINLKFNKTLIDKLIKDQADSDNTKNGEKIYNYIKDIEVTNEVEVPGVVLESNATKDINKNIKEWTYKFNQINENTIISFSYKAKSHITSISTFKPISMLGSGFILMKKSNLINKIKELGKTITLVLFDGLKFLYVVDLSNSLNIKLQSFNIWHSRFLKK